MRRLLAALAVLSAAAGPLPAQPVAEEVLVISRAKVLQESDVARRLNEAEAAMTGELQTRVDAVKQRLSAEEQELTRLRNTLPREEFERRVQAFDKEVRRERLLTQRRAAALQTAFRRARTEIAEALVPILVAISREKGARLVLDRDQILLAHPSIDVTDEVIAMMNERVPVPELPTLEDLEPLLDEEPPAPEDDPPPQDPEGDGD